jgi:Flp pilus assembly protein TadB
MIFGLENYYSLWPYAFCAFAFLVYILHKLNQARYNNIENSIVEVMQYMAESLKAGNSFETVVLNISKSKSYACAGFFRKIINKANKGTSIEKAFMEEAEKTHNEILIFFSEIVSLSYSSKANIVYTLKELSAKLAEIRHLQSRIDEKASGALTMIQFTAILLLPIVFYFIAAVLNSADTPLFVDSAMKAYFLAATLLFSFMDYILFKDLKETAYMVFLGLSIYFMNVICLGPLITNLFANVV